MPINAQALIAKIQALPAERIAEVDDFVEFLSAKTRRQEALGRLLAVAPALDAAGVAPLSEAEIQTEVDAVRTQRRTRQTEDRGAARS